jgi:hypothetical protein
VSSAVRAAGGALKGFLTGRELNRRFYIEAVAPVLESRFPRLRYSAALVGPGSEVLGYDSPQSTDHDWGPRAQIFLTARTLRTNGRRIRDALRDGLPSSFAGYSTHFGVSDSDGVHVREKRDGRRLRPLVQLTTIRGFLQGYLRVDLSRPPSVRDWLVIPQQKLLSLERGTMFRDDLGLARALATWNYYPRDVWLYLLSVEWLRIGEREAFVARAAGAGDDLGSRLLAARQTREIMRLSFLMERQYAPYEKWFGRAFRELRVGPKLGLILADVLDAETIREREQALTKAYEIVASRQNSLGLVPRLPAKVSRFHERPYLVIHAGMFAESLRKAIRDRKIREFPRIGSVDQFGDTEELSSPSVQAHSLRAIF